MARSKSKTGTGAVVAATPSEVYEQNLQSLLDYSTVYQKDDDTWKPTGGDKINLSGLFCRLVGS